MLSYGVISFAAGPGKPVVHKLLFHTGADGQGYYAVDATQLTTEDRAYVITDAGDSLDFDPNNTVTSPDPLSPVLIPPPIEAIGNNWAAVVPSYCVNTVSRGKDPLPWTPGKDKPGKPDESYPACGIMFHGPSNGSADVYFGFEYFASTGCINTCSPFIDSLCTSFAYLGDYDTIPVDAKPIKLYPPVEVFHCRDIDITDYCKAVTEYQSAIIPHCTITFADLSRNVVAKLLFNISKNPDGTYAAYYALNKDRLTVNDVGKSNVDDSIVVIPPPIEAINDCGKYANCCCAVPEYCEQLAVMPTGQDPDPAEPEDPDERTHCGAVYFGSMGNQYIGFLGPRYCNDSYAYTVFDNINGLLNDPSEKYASCAIAYLGDFSGTVPDSEQPVLLPPPLSIWGDQFYCLRPVVQSYCDQFITELTDYCAIGFGTPGQKPVHTLLYRNGTYAIDPSTVTEEVFKKAFVIGG